MDLKFPYEYVGGGYFRERGVPKGTPGEIIHGDQVVDLMERMLGAFVLLAAAVVEPAPEVSGAGSDETPLTF